MLPIPNERDIEAILAALSGTNNKALAAENITILPANPFLAGRGLIITGPSPLLPRTNLASNCRLEDLILTTQRIQDGSRERKNVLEFYIELQFLGYDNTDEVVEAMDYNRIGTNLAAEAVRIGDARCNVVRPIFEAAIRWLNRHTHSR